MAGEENEVKIKISAQTAEMRAAFAEVAQQARLITEVIRGSAAEQTTASQSMVSAVEAQRRAEQDYYSFVQARSRESAQSKIADIQQQVQAMKYLEEEERRNSFNLMSFLNQYRRLAFNFLAIVGTLTGAALAIKRAYDFAEEGAQIERLRTAGTQFAASFGINMTSAVEKIKRASLDTISSNQAILDTNKALLENVATDSDTLAKLMEVAAIRGRLVGVSTDEAYNRIIVGIGRLSTRMLTQLGIVVDDKNAYDNYAKSIGTTADKLTDQEKRTALTNAVIRDGNKILAEAGGLTRDDAQAFEEIAARIKDLGNNAKEAFTAGLMPLVIALRNILEFSSLPEALRNHATQVQATAKTYAEYDKELRRAAETQNLVITTTGDLITYQGNLIVKGYELTKAQYDLAKSEEAANDVEGRRIKNAIAMRQAQDDLNQKIQDAIDKFNTLTGTEANFSLQDAAKEAIKLAEAMGQDSASINQLQHDFGLIDSGVQEFKDAMTKAAADGKITSQEIADAFATTAVDKWVSDSTKALDKFNEAMSKLRADLKDKMDQLNLDFGRKQEDQETDLFRKLSDIEHDRVTSEEDVETKHKRTLEKIELDHQREIDRILERYEKARLKALIDRDARALFEAMAQRDQDLADAKKSAKEKQDDAEKERQDELKKLQDDYDERVAKAKEAFNRQREDALRDYQRRQQDLQDDFDKRAEIERENYVKEQDAIDAALKAITFLMNQEYQQRITDRINYWKTVNLIDSIMGAGGEPPPTTTPGPTGTEPPPRTAPNPTAFSPLSGNVFGTSAPVASGSGSTIKVSLNVTGDGVIAGLVRQAAYQAIIDVVKS